MKFRKTFGLLLVVSMVWAFFVPSALADDGTTRPANDSAAAATVIETMPFSVTASLRGATLETGEAVPSCARPLGSVWFTRQVSKDESIDIAASMRAKGAVTAYLASAEGWAELACAKGAAIEMTVDLRAGQVLLLQVANTTSVQPTFDLDVRPARWQKRLIQEHAFVRETQEQKIPVLRVEGAPRANDPSMYDVTITVSTQIPIRRSILTFGLVKEKIDVEALTIPASSTKVFVTVSARYDSSQYTCLSDQGSGSECDANAPIKDLGWLSSDGSSAELVIHLTAVRNGDVLADKAISVPFAGQVTGLLP